MLSGNSPLTTSVFQTAPPPPRPPENSVQRCSEKGAGGRSFTRLQARGATMLYNLPISELKQLSGQLYFVVKSDANNSFKFFTISIYSSSFPRISSLPINLFAAQKVSIQFWLCFVHSCHCPHHHQCPSSNTGWKTYSDRMEKVF